MSKILLSKSYMLRTYDNWCGNILKTSFIILREIICYHNWKIFLMYMKLWGRHKRKNCHSGYKCWQPLVFKRWPVDQQHQHHLAGCQKCGSSGSSQTCWKRICIILRSLGDFYADWYIRNISDWYQII